MDVDPPQKNILIVGNRNSGKSSFLYRLCDLPYPIVYTPSGEIEYKNYFEWSTPKRGRNKKYFLFNFVVIPGNIEKIDEYRCYFHDKDAVFIFVDLENTSSPDEFSAWVDEISLIYPKSSTTRVAGCKADVVLRKMGTSDIKDFCQDEDLRYVEISNKNTSYLDIFEKLF